MKTYNIKLSIGEVTLTEDDMRHLKVVVDEVFLTIDHTPYEELKRSPKEVINEVIGKMTHDELLALAKVNDLHKEESYYPDPFSQSIYRELFKRKGIGYRQLRRLSAKQRDYLVSLGLRYK